MLEIRSRLVSVNRTTIIWGAALFVGVCIVSWNWIQRPRLNVMDVGADAANKTSHSESSSLRPIKVDVIKPRSGGLDRTSIQPGSIHAFESAELFSKVSGYLQKLHVDIGDRVAEGQLLAEIDSPELHRDVDRSRAAVDRASAQVGQMTARVVAAEADHRAAETGIARAEAGVKRDVAAFEFRDKQLKRFRELVNAKSVDERLVDEKEDQRLAAQAAVDASQATLAESRAFVAASTAKIQQARADLVEAEAQVEVAKANLARAEVFAGYTKVTAPYNGVITSRAFHRGDFIRGAEQSGVHPLLTVERTDVVRLVVFVPDNDVPYTEPGDETITEIDALPGHKFIGKISRIAFSEDKKSKTMRTEVDLPNDRGLLRNGMYGKTKLMLQTGDPRTLTIPSSALSGATKDGKAIVFVARDGIAKKTSIEIGIDTGVIVEVTSGLSLTDSVIVGNNNGIVDGRAIEPREITTTAPVQR